MEENTNQEVNEVVREDRPVERESRPSSGGEAEGGTEGRPARRRFVGRAKVCTFCVEKSKKIDYKDVDLLRRFLTDRAKIRPRRQTGTCARHQRTLARAIKRARHVALLPFVAAQLWES